MGKDSAAQIELGRSFHQMGTVNEKVCERDFDKSACKQAIQKWVANLVI